MEESRRTARSIGLLYLVTMLPAPFSLVYVPGRFIVAGDATATAHNIAAGEMVYRIGILCGLFNILMWVVLVLSLHAWLKDVDRKQARLMVMFVAAAVAIGLVDAVISSAPLVLLSGAKYLSAFTEAQLDALVLACLKLRSAALGVATALWGLWLLPFGILVYKSGFIPRFIGVLLIIGCAGYLAQSLTSILWPAYNHDVFNWTLPFEAPSEIAVVLWLLIKGGSVPLARTRSPLAATAR